jgi:hypothetical protein
VRHAERANRETMIRQILIAFLLGVCVLSYSQTCSHILNYEANQNWLDSFKISSIDIQIEMFKERMLCDTLIKVRNILETDDNHDFISKDKTTYFAENRLKIYFTHRKMIYNRFPFRYIFHKDLKYIQFKRTNNTKPDKIVEICNFISKSKLSGFYHLSPSSKAHSESDLIWGAVMIDFKRGKDFEIFKKMTN